MARIAVNTRLLIKDRLEGIGHFTAETLKRITAAHPEHEFLFFFDRDFSSEFLFSSNIEPVILFPPARHPALWYLWFEHSLPRALEKYKADVLLSPDGYLSLSSSGKQLVVMHDISFIHFAREHAWSHRLFMNHYAPQYAQKANRIFTVSEFSKHDIAKTFKVNAGKIDVGYNGCNPAFKPVSEKTKTETKNDFTGGHEYFLVLGMGNPRKNIERVIIAFTKFRKQQQTTVKLLMIGHRKYWSTETWKAYHSSEVKKDIVIVPYLSQAGVIRAVASAHALIYASLFEGFGIPILEAMNCNVPVLASNTSSMPEVCGDAALMVDPYSVKSISEEMIRIYSDELLRNNLIEKSKTQRSKFSWNHTAEALWKSVEKVLAM